MKFNGYTLISDLDGTLLDSNKKISKKNLDAIKYFQDEGGKFTIATGRAVTRVEMYKDILKPDLPAIFLNGIAVVDFYTHKVYWEGHIDDSIREIALDIEACYPDFGLEIFAGNTNYYININEHLKKQIKDEGYDNKTHSLNDIPLPWQKVLIGTSENFLNIMEDKYSAYKDKFSFTRSDSSYYEILGKGINKGTALLKLKEISDVDLEKTICIGDNLNDLELIKNAGISAAVGNASGTVKKYADIIVSDNDNSPLYDLIDILSRR